MKRAIELQSLPENPTTSIYLIHIHGNNCEGVHLAKRIGVKRWTMICLIPGTNTSKEDWVFVGNYPNLKIWEIKPGIKKWEYRRIIMNLLVNRDPNTIISTADNTLIFKRESD